MDSTPDIAARQGGPDTPAGPRVSTSAGVFGMWIGMFSIDLAFAAGLIFYAQMCNRVGVGRLTVPTVFWFSTFVILISSLMWQYAWMAARTNYVNAMRGASIAAVLLALLFLILQIPGLLGLVQAHRAAAHEGDILYVLVIILVSLHAAHIIGGIIPMTVVTTRSVRRPDAASRLTAFKIVAMYWHYLTVIWMAMFAVFHFVH